MSYMITRPKNGHSINGDECLCDENGEIIHFDTIPEAKQFLYAKGYTDERIKNEGIGFEKDDDDPDDNKTYYTIAKPGNEYMCGENGLIYYFDTPDEAKQFLYDRGYTDKDIKKQRIYFEEVSSDEINSEG